MADTAQTLENTRNIAALTNTVTELATIVKITEKQRDQDRVDMREIVSSIKGLSDKIGSMSGFQETIHELKENVRIAAHDARSAQGALNLIPDFKERLGKVESTQDAHGERIKSVEDKLELQARDGNIMSTDIGALKSDVSAINTWRSEIKGGAVAVEKISKAAWAIIGGVVVVIGWVLINFGPSIVSSIRVVSGE